MVAKAGAGTPAGKPRKGVPQPTVHQKLRTHALSLPEAWEDFPWGESVVKVGKKVFVFLGIEPDPADRAASAPAHASVKLPVSAEEALSFPDAAPTGYGLGRAGWVSVPVEGTSGPPPIDLVCDWIEESYRAVAPKRLSARIGPR